MKAIAKSLGSFSKRPASPKPSGYSPAAAPATDIAGRSVGPVPRAHGVHGYASPSGAGGHDPARPAPSPAAPVPPVADVGGVSASPGALHSPAPSAPLLPPASARSGVSAGGGGTLKEYHLQTQYGDLQRASYARQHTEQCAVCQDMFATKGPRTPKIAPCLHSICRECVAGLPNSMCPLDFLPVQGQDGQGGDTVAPDSLHTNWMVLARLDMANLQQGRPRHCDLCDDESSESVSAQHCSHCNLHLCQLHASAHQRSKVSPAHAARHACARLLMRSSLCTCRTRRATSWCHFPTLSPTCAKSTRRRCGSVALLAWLLRALRARANAPCMNKRFRLPAAGHVLCTRRSQRPPAAKLRY